MTGHRENWFHERESAWLYRRVAAHEPDPRKQKLFASLAAGRRTAGRALGTRTPTAAQMKSSCRHCARGSSARLLRWVGPRALRAALAAMKLRGLSVYDSRRFPGTPMPTSVEQIGVRHERVSGGNLRAAVFGVNDGLVSNPA